LNHFLKLSCQSYAKILHVRRCEATDNKTTRLIAFLAALIDGIIKILGSGVAFDWPHLQPVVIAGISAALAYLLKSLSTNSRNQLFTKEPK
jgi:hypothetical protein